MNQADLTMLEPSRFGWMTFLAIALAYVLWRRRVGGDSTLQYLFFFALLGGLMGSKLLYLVSAGWDDWAQPDRWPRLVYGKSILGALIGGYLAVTWAKRYMGYDKPTGGLFALIVPLGLIVGRLGCFFQGCCAGLPCEAAWYAVRDRSGASRLPAVEAEIVFNAAIFVVFLVIRKRGNLQWQLFHIYMMAYGAFRVAVEFMRDRAVLGAGLDAYQLAALGLVALGAYGYIERERTLSKQAVS